MWPLSEPDGKTDLCVIGLPDGKISANLRDSVFCWPLWVEISDSLSIRFAQPTHLCFALVVQPERCEACICMLVTLLNGCLPWEIKTLAGRGKILVFQAP